MATPSDYDEHDALQAAGELAMMELDIALNEQASHMHVPQLAAPISPDISIGAPMDEPGMQFDCAASPMTPITQALYDVACHATVARALWNHVASHTALHTD